ncbi:diacylglycerol kinase family protein [Chitinophaga silvatica]|uniref:Diacylglycerol kinase family protein n=1 Tax=Chitinophaga silvatica TaxID=2282649 RepID=A0A3E1YAJ5_9BACT|nr:diacylglycerol kinase family protein [Chitinophaga silvatica]RFS22491.1 diacylglycerol kinase family protein [Chitinophaga silvatica]
MVRSYISKRVASFGYAFNGIAAFVKSEAHAKIHVIATLVVIAAGCWYKITKVEWLFIILAIAVVFITEMLNTTVEKMMDHLSPDYHPNIKFIKDVAAGAVLIGAIAAAIIGAVIFIPYIFPNAINL